MNTARSETSQATDNRVALHRDCSAAASEPLMPYDQWKALGPEKAAEYYARRYGLTAARQGKLWAILEMCWDPKQPNVELNHPEK